MTYIPADLKREVIERAGNCCEYCRLGQDDYPFSFHIEHIRAEKHGGLTETDNLCLSCPTCNAYKGSDLTSIDSETDKITPLFNPRLHEWNTHFKLETGEITPHTGIGRATAYLLRFNLRKRINERLALTKLERYPCEK